MIATIIFLLALLFYTKLIIDMVFFGLIITN